MIVYLMYSYDLRLLVGWFGVWGWCLFAVMALVFGFAAFRFRDGLFVVIILRSVCAVSCYWVFVVWWFRLLYMGLWL